MKRIISTVVAISMVTALGSSIFASNDEISTVSNTQTAIVSTTNLVVDGQAVSVDAYLINDTNYIKLRDLAVMLNGSDKNFNVVWNNDLGAIEMASNQAYTYVGNEMSSGSGFNKTTSQTSSKIYVDDVISDYEAYNIDGYNYFKMHDVMETFDVFIGFEASTMTASIDTSVSYMSVDNLDFGVGYGSNWESGIFAPFADITAWVSGDYSNDGALNLGKIMQETGTQYFNIGFINAVDNSVNSDGVLNWGFGAYQVLSEAYGASNSQYQGIKKAISDVRAMGGDVVISIGGLNERNFFQYTDDIDVLVNTYMEIIDGFNLTRIDLDIEGGAQGYEMNKLNAQALKIVQERTGIEVVLTLPVLPTGLTDSLGLPTLQVYLDEGVGIEAVNIMAMCYGSYYGDYAVGSVDAIDSTMAQIKSAYAKIGTNLTTSQAYDKVGVTTSIGYEGWGHPVFTVADSQLVVDHSIEKNINFVSFWSMNRDSQTQSNTGIYNQYEHTNVYLGFDDSEFVPLPEEDLEDEILPETEPEIEQEDTNTPDTTTPTVPENTVPDVEYSGDYPIWSRSIEATGAYVTGYVVSYNGVIYKQVSSGITWWCEPGTNSAVWSPIGKDSNYVEPDPSEWSRSVEATGAYIPGVKVTYKGVIYTQVSSSTSWWCEPGTDSSVWKATGTDSSYVAPAPYAWSREAEAIGTYTPGTYVTHNGLTYLQVSSSISWWCEPGTNSSIWQVVYNF